MVYEVNQREGRSERRVEFETRSEEPGIKKRYSSGVQSAPFIGLEAAEEYPNRDPKL